MNFSLVDESDKNLLLVISSQSGITHSISSSMQPRLSTSQHNPAILCVCAISPFSKSRKKIISCGNVTAFPSLLTRVFVRVFSFGFRRDSHLFVTSTKNMLLLFMQFCHAEVHKTCQNCFVKNEVL